MNTKPQPSARLQLFGSRAAGSNREASDIDVLIEGTEQEINQLKEELHRFSTEQGGPLDLFRISSVDNEIDLVAAYSDPDDLRVVLVGDQEDLDDMMSYARPITLSDLKALCEQVDPLWNEMSQADRSSAKGLRP